MILGMEPKSQVISATRSGVMALFQWESEMNEFTKSAGTQSILPGQQIFFFLAGYHAHWHDLNVFLKFS